MTHYIDTQWLPGRGAFFVGHNPATEEPIWQGQAATPELIDCAINAAQTAFLTWSQLTVADRIPYLKAYQDSLLQAKSSLAEAISQSTGKPLWDSLTEVTAMINKIDISIDAYHARCPDTQKNQPQGTSLLTHRPHGVLAVLGPFNFPGHLPNGHIIPALLAGNTVVFKPSELAPLPAELMVKYWETSGLPPGVLNLVQGGRETGQYLSAHSAIDGLLFTGSWTTGQHLAIQMAKTPYKMLALEMGGNNPLVIGNIHDLEAAVYITIQSAYLTSGQRCTCARRLIVPEGENGDRFITALIKKIKDIRVGAYTDRPEPFMGPLISRQAADQLLAAQKSLITAGAKPLLELKRMSQGAAFLSPGLIDISAVPSCPDVEYFGPLLQLKRVSDFPEAIQEANRTRYGLTAGLLSQKREEYSLFYSSIKAGLINWNAPLTGASSAAPFGGIGQSGNLRPSAFYAADYCAYPVASLVSEELRLPATISPGLSIEKKDA